MQDRAIISAENILLQKLDMFLSGWFHYQQLEEISISQSFKIAGNVPVEFEEILLALMKLYENIFHPEAVAEVLILAQDMEDLSLFLDHPDSEFTSEMLDKNFTKDAASIYLLQAMLLIIIHLPKLQNVGFTALTTSELLNLQQAIHQASFANSCANLIQNFNAEKTRQAKNGGKARAEKLYGKTKLYVKNRFKEIRAKGCKLSMSQIALKLADELEQEPIVGDEPLSNPYDTIYRWVRAINRV